jgi:hypothetical protein
LVTPAAADRPRKTRHTYGLPPELNNGVDEQVLMPWARVVVLEEGNDPRDAMLYRYGGDDFDVFAGDTWSESVEQAKAQAEFEYGELLGAWEEIPVEVDDALAYAARQARSRG